MLFMKRFLILLILIFTLQTPSQADDIRDFQIEGMSIGDSLLDYMSEEEIKKNEIIDVYKDNKFILSLNNKSSENYDEITIAYKSKDKKYKIYGMSGIIDFGNDIKGCYKKQKEIESEFDSFFKNTKKIPRRIATYSGDKTGKSKVTRIAYRFNDGSRVGIQCYKWSKEELKENRNKHRLSILIGTSEYIAWNIAWWKKFRETK